MLKTLCELNGTSGREHAVREFIISKLPKDVDYRIDAIGNLIVNKKGKQRAKNKVVLDAHMDEVAFIITYITDDGYLKFAPVGGIDERVVFGRTITVGNKSVVGVIGGKAVHHLSSDEKDKLPKIQDMFIDIGAESKDEALDYVSLGDIAYFKSDFIEFGEGFIKSKALDDRFGCSLMLDMISTELPYDLTFSFSVQEEIGTRGASCMAFSENPDYVIVIETTTAADIPDVPSEKKVCLLGDGAVVSFMDSGTLYDKDLYEKAFEIAEKNNIKCQTKTVVAGGNNAAAIHKSRGGIKTLAISAPTRYIHSPSCVVKRDDIEAVSKLVWLMAQEFSQC